MNCCKHISATGPEISRGTLNKKRKKVAKSPHILLFVQMGGEGGKKRKRKILCSNVHVWVSVQDRAFRTLCELLTD